MNVITRFHGFFAPWQARHRRIGRYITYLIPVLTDVMLHAETPWGIEPLYKYKIFLSPSIYAKHLKSSGLPGWAKPVTFVLGMVFGPLLALLFHQMGNVRDVRWRVASVRRLLIKAITSFADRGERLINVGIYGSGSARYALNAWKIASDRGLNVRIYLIDKDRATFSLAARVARELGIQDEAFKQHFIFVKEDVLSIPDAYFKTHGDLDVVTFIGIGDHFDKRYSRRGNADSVLEADVRKTNPALINAFEKILSQLNRGGIFITSFVNHNVEESYMTKVIDWKHRYRTEPMLAKIFEAAGWGDREVRLYAGPCRIQNTLWVGTKG